MVSAKQLAANRANAQLSTGPRTEAGKRIASMNSIQHGLAGHTIFRTPEQDAAYQAYSDRLMPELAPANAVEQDFTERIIFDSWRIHRASAIESNLFALADPEFDHEALNEAHTFQVNEKSIALLSLYQQRLQRGIHKDLALLRQMQKERRAQALKPPAKPALQLVDKPTPQPEIGSVCPLPPEPASPPPVSASNDPHNLAA
jgi:hypothetical protein